MGAALPVFTTIGQGILANKGAKAATDAANKGAAAQVQATQMGIQAQKEMQQEAFNYLKGQTGEAREMFSPYSRQGLRAAAAFEYLRTGRMPTAADMRDISGVTSYRRQLEELRKQAGGVGDVEDLNQQIESIQKDLQRRNVLDAEGNRLMVGGMPSGDDITNQVYQEGISKINSLKEKIAAAQGYQEQITSAEAALAEAEAATAEGWEPPDMESSALYKQQLEESNRALERRFRAAGGVGSDHSVELQRRATQALAAQETERMKADYLNMMQMGQSAAGQIAGSGANTGGQIAMITSYGQGIPGSLYGQAGAAEAQAASVAGGAKIGQYQNYSNLLGDLLRSNRSRNLMDRDPYSNLNPMAASVI